MRKLVVVTVAVLALCAGFATPSADAAKLTRCARKVINDWYDGQIEGRYPAHCYREAIRWADANPDLEAYSSLADDLRAALLKRLRGGIVAPGARGKHGAPRDPKNQVKVGLKAGGPTIVPIRKPGENGPGSGGRAIGARDGRGNDDSFPLPLVILGVLGGLLLVASAATYGRSWLAARRAAGPPADGAGP